MTQFRTHKVQVKGEKNPKTNQFSCYFCCCGSFFIVIVLFSWLLIFVFVSLLLLFLNVFLVQSGVKCIVLIYLKD